MNVVASYRELFEVGVMASMSSHGIAYGQSALALRRTPCVGLYPLTYREVRLAAHLRRAYPAHKVLEDK